MAEPRRPEPAESQVDEAIDALAHADPESREAEAAEEVVYPADETNEG